MGEDAAEARRCSKAFERFNDVIVHETYATDLMRFENRTKMVGYVQVGLVTGMIDIDQDVAYEREERTAIVRTDGNGSLGTVFVGNVHEIIHV